MPTNEFVNLQFVKGGMKNVIATVSADLIDGDIKVAGVPDDAEFPEGADFLLGTDVLPLSVKNSKIVAVPTRKQAKFLAQAEKQETNFVDVVDPVINPVADPIVELPDADPINNVLVPKDRSVEVHNLVDAGLAAIDVENVVDYKVRQVVDTSNEHEDVVNLNVSIENLVLLKKKDKSVAHLYERLNFDDKNVKYFINNNGVLCREYVRDNLESVIQIVVPYKLRTDLLKLAHDIASSGHLGVVKTKDRLLLTGFYWLSIGKDDAYYCKTCDVCQRTNKSCVKYKTQMVKPPVIDQPFYRIFIDIKGPIAKSNKKGSVFILTVVDHATS